MAIRRENYNPFGRACKICLCNDGSNPVDKDETSRLEKCPCKCRGSMGWVHLDCLTKWLNTSGKLYCEICRQKYNFRIHRESGSRAMLTKFLILCVNVFGIYAGPYGNWWQVESPIDNILWFIFKVLMASIFVDWLFIKLGLKNKDGKSMIVLELK